METNWARKLATFIFYSSLTVLPTLVWLIANFYEDMSYPTLAMLAMLPMLIFSLIRSILDAPLAPPAPSSAALSSAAQYPDTGAQLPD